MFETTIDCHIPFMAKLYDNPHIESENWIIHTFEITKDNWYTIISDGILPGKYVSLNRKGMGHENSCMMSDTPMERFTNQEFINNATGNILIAGLGIGMLPAALVLKDDVSSITILENDQEIIDMVEPLLQKYVNGHEKIHIIKANAYTFPLTYDGPKFDYLWLDIWADFPNTEEDVEMFESLFSKYKPIMNEPRMNGWGYEYACEIGMGIEPINPIETDAFVAYCEEFMIEQHLCNINEHNSAINLIDAAKNVTEYFELNGQTIAI